MTRQLATTAEQNSYLYKVEVPSGMLRRFRSSQPLALLRNSKEFKRVLAIQLGSIIVGEYKYALKDILIDACCMTDTLRCHIIIETPVPHPNLIRITRDQLKVSQEDLPKDEI